MKKENLIQEKTTHFALQIIDLFKKLETQKEYVISKQLLKSGTSIGANVIESEAAESKKDFLHKISIASKEARETLYWLNLLKKSNLLQINIDKEIEDVTSIINILTSIIKTTQERYGLK